MKEGGWTGNWCKKKKRLGELAGAEVLFLLLLLFYLFIMVTLWKYSVKGEKERVYLPGKKNERRE